MAKSYLKRLVLALTLGVGGITMTGATVNWEGITVTTHDDGTCTLSNGALCKVEGYELDIPETITLEIDGVTSDYTVTSLADNCFENTQYLKRITVPATATYIGASCFAKGSQLKEVVFNCEMDSVPEKLFYRSGVQSVTLPEGIKKIGDNAFYDCTSLRLPGNALPDSVTEIGDYAFFNCPNIEIDQLPAGLKTIGNEAFRMCSKLAITELPDGVNSVGEGAFEECRSIVTMYVPGSVGDRLGDSAFSSCSGLRNIVFGEGITLLPGHVLTNDVSQCNVVIPSTVTSIGRYALASDLYHVQCHAETPPGIYSDTFDTEFCNHNMIVYVRHSCLETYKTTKYWEDLRIEAMSYDLSRDGMTFAINSNGTTVTLVSMDETVEGEFHLPATVSLLECGHETLFTVTAIGDGAFKNQDKMTAIWIPADITSIGAEAFAGCTSLGYFHIARPTLPTASGSSFDEWMYANTAIWWKEGAHVAYPYDLFKNVNHWHDVMEKDGAVYSFNADKKTLSLSDGSAIEGEFTVPGEVSLLVNLDMHTYSVTNIGAKAFTGNEKLTGITIPASVAIGDNAFALCSNLEYANIAVPATTVATTVSASDTTLPEPPVPTTPSAGRIAIGAFYNCGKLSEVTIGRGITEIWVQAFYGTAIESIDIHAGVEILELGAFGQCKKLRDVTLPHSLEYVGALAFRGDDSIEEINIPIGVTQLNAGAFSDCKGLKTVHVPSSMTLFKDNVFSGSDAIERVICLGIEPADIPDNSFDDTVYRTATLEVPEGPVSDSSVEKYRNATGWGNFLTITDDNSTTGVEDVVTDSGMEAVYYDLRGVRVDNPRHGIYIRVTPDGSSKVAM